MLNRLFIAIGVLVILAISSAFILPALIQWGDYRGRLEGMATAAFGAPVAITGDIHLMLLPSPHLEFAAVQVGPKDAPVIVVDKVEAEFSLFDFLRDQYVVTRLTLDRPVVTLALGADGSLASGIPIVDTGGPSTMSINNASVVDGTVRLTDARSGKTFDVEAVNGQVTLAAVRGPFGFTGTATLDKIGYDARVSLGKFDAGAKPAASIYLRPNDNSFTLEANGTIDPGASPKFTGDLSYKRPPPRPKPGEVADAGRGDFSLEGKVDATTDRVVLTNYVALPDVNRPAGRLTGTAELKLGADLSFNAEISGGVMALPPRDATKELTDPPYELVRLLGETPLPPVPDIPGTVALDINELGLRAITLRNVRLDASTDARSWTVKSLTAALPGSATVTLAGDLTSAGGHPVFAGTVALDAPQLDRLAALWRKPPVDDPLLGQSGSLHADVALSGETLGLSAGTVSVAGLTQGFDAEIGFGAQRSLKVGVHFDNVTQDQSAVLAALMPDVISSGSFGATFPKGEVDLSAGTATVFGLSGTNLAASATWDGGVLEFSKLAASDLGGATFDAKVTAFGTLLKPELSGSGTLTMAPGAPLLSQVLSSVKAPAPVGAFLDRALPADLTLKLDAPTGDGAQTLTLTGTLNAAQTTLSAKLGAGIINALTAPLTATLDMTSPTPHLLAAQLGLGDAALFDERTPLHLTASVDGVPSNSYTSHFRLEDGPDHLDFTGDVLPGDFSAISGKGKVDVALADPTALLEALGAGGFYVPAVAGAANLAFEGADSLEFSGIESVGATGDISLTRRDGKLAATGTLAVPSFDARALLPFVAGASSTLQGPDSLWPDGPIDIGSAARSSEGRIDVTVPSVSLGGAPLLTDASFGIDWDAQTVHLRNFGGKIGGGTLTFDATVCCSSATLPSKQINGRLALDGVALNAVVPPAVSAGLSGTVKATAEFAGTGASVAEAVGALTGSGSYEVRDFSAARLDPGTFAGLASLTGVVDAAPEDLATAVSAKLGAAPFTAPDFTAGFTIAGGVLRSPNVAIEGQGARLFGTGSLALPTLMLDGRYAMSPTAAPDDTSPLDPATAEIDVTVSGPLWTPSVSFDVASMVEGMKIKASEAELAHLQQLKAEADARASSAAAEDARLSSERAASEASESSAIEAAASAFAASASSEAAASSASSASAASASSEAASRAAASSSSAASADLGM